MVYPDTSIIVAALTIEPGSPIALDWLEAASGMLFISDWTVTEVASALAAKVRAGSVTSDQRAVAMAVFRRMTSRTLTVVPVVPEVFRIASRFAERPETKLSAGDALHLAIAFIQGLSVATFDKRMAAAGPIVGVAVDLVA